MIKLPRRYSTRVSQMLLWHTVFFTHTYSYESKLKSTALTYKVIVGRLRGQNLALSNHSQEHQAWCLSLSNGFCLKVALSSLPGQNGADQTQLLFTTKGPGEVHINLSVSLHLLGRIKKNRAPGPVRVGCNSPHSEPRCPHFVDMLIHQAALRVFKQPAPN